MGSQKTRGVKPLRVRFDENFSSVVRCKTSWLKN